MRAVLKSDSARATVFRFNRRRAVGAVAVLFLLFSCASPAPPVPVTRATPRDDPYLVAPLGGYPLTVDRELSERLGAAHTGLRQGRELTEVEAAGRGLLEDDPGFHPATVLLAQIAYARRDDLMAVELLRPVVDELPDYAAAQLLLGHVSERSGDLPAALESFERVVDAGLDPGSELAAQRSLEIRPRAIEIVSNRLREDLGRRQVESAESHLAWLEEWVGDSREAIEGRRLVAVEKGDLEAELESVRRLAAETGERAFLEREGELEVQIGDVRRGLEKLEALALEHPDDPQLGEKLELAKFLWRLQLLPSEVQEIGRLGELDRSDFATLLYWLVPRVRYSQISNPPIATDILDHPRRDVILRVLNLDLLEVDETLHRFEPAEPATRVVVFRALLTLLASSEQQLSCLDGAAALELDRSWHTACQQTARCRLIPEAADCRPAASISGPEVLELFRHTLDLLGS